jgi:hypothetical protein
MSVLVAVRVSGDTMAFQKALANRAEEFEAHAARAKAMGAVHHRFGIGDGFILVVDEWDSAESFQQFFGDPELQAFIGTIGGSPEPPQITITEAIASPDQF